MRKTFEIKNTIILSHLSKQPNQTKYIENLISKDMKDMEENKQFDKTAIIEIIKEFLEGRIDPGNDKDVKNSITNILKLAKK